MGAQHHYVSKFHLRQFTDPDSLALKDPWLWQGLVRDGSVKRRAPKNVGTVSLMFDGTGGLADRDATLESFLAHEVEGPAAEAMREVCRWPVGSSGELPHALTRYLAWAAARSLPMQDLFKAWAQQRLGQNGRLAESPPEWLMRAKETRRDARMVHPAHGPRAFPADTNWEGLASEGWLPDMDDPANFLEVVHVQASYFGERFLPRFKWFTLHAPPNAFFVIADRAVGWVASGRLDAPPSCLRDPSAYILAPLSRNLVLVGKHTTEIWHVTPDQINAVVACWAHRWIAGPTRATVESAMEARRQCLSDI